VEQVASLRLIPNLSVIRPADGLETAAAWGMALERRDGPTLIALTRQKTTALARPAGFDPASIRRGGYVLAEHTGKDAVTLIATGSEVGLAVEAARRLVARGIPARVVSMPARERFLEQDASWRDAVLPPGGRRVSIEAGVTWDWRGIVGERGLSIGLDRFGESAPAEALAEHFGFTPEQVEARIAGWLGEAAGG